MKSLETYIHKAQQAKSAVPLLSHDELRSIVQQKLDGSVQTSSAVSHSSFNYKGLIMASLIGSLAVGALMWLQLGNPLAAVVQTAVQSQPIRGSELSSSTPSAKAGQQVQQQRIVVDTRGSAPDNAAVPKSGTTQTGAKNTQSAIPFIMASAAELKALGIEQKDGVFQCTIEEQYNEKESPAEAKLFIAKMGYPLDVDPLILRAKAMIKANISNTEGIHYDPSWNASKPIGCSPYACAFYSGTEHSISTTMSTSDHSPYVKSQDIARELKREFDQLSKDVTRSIDNDFVNKPFLPLGDRPYKYAKYLVPVGVNISTDTSIEFAIFYYVPTKYFLERLSAKHQQDLAFLKPVLAQDQLTVDYDGVSLAVDEEKIVTPTSIAGIQHLSLSDAELEAIGVHVRNGSIEFDVEQLDTPDLRPLRATTERQRRQQQHRRDMDARQRAELRSIHHYNIDPSTVLVRRKVQLDLGCETDISIVPYSGWSYDQYNPVSPVGYSANGFEMRPSQRVATFEKMRCIDQQIVGNSPLLQDKTKDFALPNADGQLVSNGSTIPVRIMLGTTHDALPNSFLPKEGADSAHYHVKMIDIFFVPNRDFVERLPERYRVPLMIELNMIDRIIKGEIALDQACEELHKTQTHSMLEICGTPSGAIQSLQVFPNPIGNGSAQCSFSAREEGSYNISLYNLNGGLELNMLQTNFRKGFNSISLPVKDVQQGVYLLTISNSKGVQATHRIIVQ